MHYRVLTFYSA